MPDISPIRVPSPSSTKAVDEVSPTRGWAVENVPAPEYWFCQICGARTSALRKRLLGGWAEVRCPNYSQRVVGLPTPPKNPKGHQ